MYLILNGKIVKRQEAALDEIFSGDPFIVSRKIWFGHGGIPLFENNLELLAENFRKMKLSVPEILRNSGELFRITKRMIRKNRFFRSGIIHFQFFVHGSETSFLGQCFAHGNNDFPLSQSGSLVQISGFRTHTENLFNNYLSYNQAVSKMMDAWLRNSDWKGEILLNEKEMVCEGSGGNIFMVKDDVLITPSPDTGCFIDTVRKPILETAIKHKIKVMELANIREKQLFSMNEIFFASEEKGIEWIMGIGQRRFISKFTRRIHLLLNEYLKEKAERQ